jgi:histidyl-tRNA synthetase
MDEEAIDLVMKLAHEKRKTDKTTIDYKTKNLKNHLKAADKVNAQFCCVIGENELKNKTVWVKDLENKVEEIVSLESFLTSKSFNY